MIAIVRRAPVASFAVLAYAIAWIPWFISLATHQRFGGLFPFGPMIAAVLVAAASGGWAGVRELGARLARWRFPLRWWGIALIVALAPIVITAVGVPLLGGRAPDPVQLAKWPRVLAAFPLVLLLGGPLGEELGWRGFGVSKLVEQGRRPLFAGLIIGLIWAGWHFPLFMTHRMPPPAAVVMAIGAVTMAWIYLHARQSALLMTLFHTVGNTVGGAWFFSLFAREDIGKVILIRVAVELLMAAAVMILAGKDLGLKTREARHREGASPPQD